MQPRAAAARRTRQPAAETQRVQAEGRPRDQGAVLFRRVVNALAHRVPRQQFGVEPQHRCHRPMFGFEAGKRARRVRDLHLGRAERVDVDVLVDREVAHQLDGPHLRPIPVPRRLGAEMPDHAARFQAGAADTAEAAVAA